MTKSLLLLSTILLGSSTVASADDLSPSCYSLAASTVSFFVEKGIYDHKGGIVTEHCELTLPRGADVVCTVLAVKAQGMVTDTYQVYLNKECNSAYRNLTSRIR